VAPVAVLVVEPEDPELTDPDLGAVPTYTGTWVTVTGVTRGLVNALYKFASLYP